MSRYADRFNDHPVHERLRTVSEQLADLPEDLRKEAEEQEPQDVLERLAHVLDYIGALLGSADPALVSEGMLNGLDGPLQQIGASLGPLKDGTDFTQLPSIDGNTEGLLNAAIQIAPAIGVWAQTDAKKAAASLGKAATEGTRKLNDVADALETRLGELRTEMEQTSAEAKTASEQRFNEFEERLSQLQGEADGERTRIAESVDNFRQQFEAAQEARNTEYQALKEELRQQGEQVATELRTQAEERATALEQEAEKTKEELQGRANAVLESLEKSRDEAAELVDLVSTSATAGAFGKEADAQKKEADRWRDRALLIGAVTAVVAIAAIVLSVAIETSVSLIVAKVAAVALLVGIAGYAAGQSQQHHRREQRARRLELELTAFGPFSEPLDDPDKVQVRKDFIARLFVGDPGEDDKAQLTEQNISLVAQLFEAVRSGPG